MIDRPAAVFVLVAENLAHALLRTLVGARAQHLMQEDVVGFEGGVGFELAAPVAFG